MEMFLTVLVMSVLGVIVSAVAFAAATREERAREAEPHPVPALDLPTHFFVDPKRPPVPMRVPVEALLLQIERHVRLEQAAAESFMVAPTSASLHMTTTSPLVH